MFTTTLFLSALLSSASPGASHKTVATLLEPSLLNALEEQGFSFAHFMLERVGQSDSFGRDMTLSGLNDKSALYRSFADQIGRPIVHDKNDQLPKVLKEGLGDIPEMVRLMRGVEDKGKRSSKDLKGGFYIRSLSNNAKYPYAVEYDGDEPRHFDHRWLRSAFARFVLVGVVNRIDKKDFTHGACGEIRFVYRLGYRTPKTKQTLPFFINIATRLSESNCAKAARAWQVPLNKETFFDHNHDAYANFFKEGALQGLKFEQLEVNFQSLRFTSGYMHDFGGQAMYMQRVFQKKGEGLVPVSLENTPNVLALEKDPKLFERFLTFLKRDDNLKKLDEGRLLIDFDEAFLAKRSVSWSTAGRVRDANKPYRRLFEGRHETLNDIDFSKLSFIKSERALIERLDNLTCMGCHQTGGTAGFHMPGFAPDDYSHSFNKQALAYSPHAFAEHQRRERYVSALANNEAPELFRAHSAFRARHLSVENKQPARALCTLGDDFGVALECEEGLLCHATVQEKEPALLGECVLPRQTPKESLFAGGVCFEAKVNSVRAIPKNKRAPTYNFFAFQDKMSVGKALHQRRGKGKKDNRYSCASPKSGAPLGRRGRACTYDEEVFKTVDALQPKVKRNERPDELCANQGGNGFDMCAASGDAGTCLESRVARSMLDTCELGAFCREDYICQALPDYHKISARNYGRKKRKRRVNRAEPEAIDAKTIDHFQKKGVGFCVPTYFLFNMRVDGHVRPTSGKPAGRPKIDRTKPLRGYK